MATPREFVLEIKKFSDDLKGAVKRTNQVVTLESQARLKRLNPKDTGWSANNWNLAIGEADLELRPSRRPRKKIKIKGADTEAVGKIKYNSIIFITNNTPYVVYLEEGRSTQQSAGWFARTSRQAFKRYDTILNDQIRKGVK